MGKRICVSLICIAMFLGIGGCFKAKPPATTQTGTPSAPAPSEYVESTLENLHIAPVTDELMSKFNSFHEYTNDEDGEKLVIWTDKAVTDFAFISVECDAAGDGVSCVAGDTLFLVDELAPEKPFAVKLMIPGTFPAYGISFVDENGVQRYFTINMDGRGADEAPPYFLLEFENAED